MAATLLQNSGIAFALPSSKKSIYNSVTARADLLQAQIA